MFLKVELLYVLLLCILLNAALHLTNIKSGV